MSRDPVLQRLSSQETTVQPQCSKCGQEESVQLAENGQKSEEKSIQEIAADGFTGSATSLPHLNSIQQSFGQNLSPVQAYIGGPAAAASDQLRAHAYTSGNKIAFKEQPSLELAAHEAAHVVQQASGTVQLASGTGRVGDKYEQHADAVADLVARGESAAPLLAPFTGAASPAVQAMSHDAMEGKDDSSASLMSSESGAIRAIQSTEAQGWIDLALAAIEQGRFQDALRAYDEGISLNPNISPTVDRGKLRILERDKEASLEPESQTEQKAPRQSDNQTEIAQSNPGAFSNLHPWEPRDNGNDESQRQEALRIVRDNAPHICRIAEEYNVTPDAIAEAILWEGIENPYPSWRVGALRTNIPGKIHPYPEDVAERVEQEGRVPALRSNWPQIGTIGPRTDRLRNPQWAIHYIGAILDRAADFYEAEASRRGRQPHNIRDQAGILGALYQGDDEERRARGFENRRTQDPRAVPQMNRDEKMGPWISQYRRWIRNELAQHGYKPRAFMPPREMGSSPLLNVPDPHPYYPNP